MAFNRIQLDNRQGRMALHKLFVILISSADAAFLINFKINGLFLAGLETDNAWHVGVTCIKQVIGNIDISRPFTTGNAVSIMRHDMVQGLPVL